MKKAFYILSFLIALTVNVFAQNGDLYKEALKVNQEEICSENSSDCEIDATQIHVQREVYYGFAFQNLNDWTIGPNPTVGTIQIFGNHDIIESIEIFSITGEMLMILEKSDAASEIDLSFYPNGIYFVRIISDFNVSKTYKIMKR